MDGWTDTNSPVSVALKWNKQTYSLTLDLGETAASFMQRVQLHTGVPVERQKLTAKHAWKGLLKDNMVLDSSIIKNPSSILTVTLIGSTETLNEPSQRTTFWEDMSPQELQAASDARAQAAMAEAQGMIPVLQLPPHERDDNKKEMYPYNRLVTGLPQRQIEQQLQRQRRDSNQLQGIVAMTLGLELRRAYVNDLAVLNDGTCVSAMDDGHVQLWKHGAQEHDVIHQGNEPGGVDSVVALNGTNTPVAFATVGRGNLQLWTADAEPIAVLPGSVPGTTPASLECVFGGVHDTTCDGITCVATRFRVTRQVDAHQFRLPPQNDAERQRRAFAEAQASAIQMALDETVRSIQIWYNILGETGITPTYQQTLLQGPENADPITCLTTLKPSALPENDQSRILVSGDTTGGLRLWKVQKSQAGLQFFHHHLYRLIPDTPGVSCSVVCMEALQDGCLAVSTDVLPGDLHQLVDGSSIPILAPRAVHILGFSHAHDTPFIRSTLTGHTNDAVICMCQLPSGGLLTGGGKLDATLQLWSRPQLQIGLEAEANTETSPEVRQTLALKTLADVGYVFSLAVLPDMKNDSNFFAVAAARYNTVKIII